jgi:hypothetical protein
MTLDDFKLDVLTIEARYENAYAMWDSAGKCAKAISQIWPGVTLKKAEPGEVAFESPGVRIITGLGTSHINFRQPKNFDLHTEAVSQTFQQWNRILEIKEYTRLGCRVIYEKSYESQDEVNRALLSLGLINFPSKKIFNAETDDPQNSIDIKYVLGDKKTGSTIRIFPNSTTVEIDTRGTMPDIDRKHTKHTLTIDIDRYTKQATTADAFRVSEWLKGTAHLIRRDLPQLLGFTS